MLLIRNSCSMEMWQSPVYCNSLENCRGCEPTVSSNLTVSAKLGSLMLTVACRSPKPIVGVRIPKDSPRIRRAGRVVEGTSLLRKHTGLNLYRGFESLALRQIMAVYRQIRFFLLEINPTSRIIHASRARSSAGESTWLRTKGSGVRISSGAPYKTKAYRLNPVGLFCFTLQVSILSK